MRDISALLVVAGIISVETITVPNYLYTAGEYISSSSVFAVSLLTLSIALNRISALTLRMKHKAVSGALSCCYSNVTQNDGADLATLDRNNFAVYNWRLAAYVC